MLWISVGLVALGAVCGALIRLPVFLAILISGALIAGVASAAEGFGSALLAALVAVIALEVGYVAGLILRATGRARSKKAAARGAGKAPVSARLGPKRR